MSAESSKQAKHQQDEHIGAFNTRAEVLLNQERQAIANAYLQHETSDRSGALSTTKAALLTITSHYAKQVATPTARTHKAGNLGAAAPSAARVLRVSLTAAATALLLGLPGLLTSDDKLTAWKTLIGTVCTAATAAGISTALVDAIRKQLVARFPDLLAKLSVAGRMVCSSAAVAGTFVAAWESTKALYYFLQAWMASMDNDTAASKKYCDKAKQLATLDTLCRVAAASVTAAVIAGGVATGMLPAAGALSVIVDTVLYWIGTSIAEHIIDRKNHYGGWLTWFRTLFQEDMRPEMWAGDTFEEREFEVTDELQCNINHTIVVDPVRYVRSGHLYERHAINAWIDANGKDPYDGRLVTRYDYVSSPLAKELAREVSEDILGAVRSRMLL